MELLDNLALGFEVALSARTLFYCFFGVTVGTLIGVLPGIGPVATIGMLLPITFYLPALEALVMLAGIYYGAMYGGSTTAILLNLPGTAASVVVCLEGHPMAKQGRAGPALVMTTLASFFGGCVAVLVVAAFAPPLARFALRFGAAEYFSLMLMGLLAAALLVHGSMLKGLAMVVLGLLLGMIGQDVQSGLPRFTFGRGELMDGLSFVVVAIGLFGLAEVIHNLGQVERQGRVTSRFGWRELIPSRRDLRASWLPMLRGTGLGSALGVLPGAGPAIASFTAYALERRVAREPGRFGKGAMEGLAGPEASNNAAAQTSFIPTLTLGVPGDATMALMLGAMMIHGVIPGPQFVTEAPGFFWGLVASFWIGNFLLLILNLPLIGVWVQVLAIPYRLLFPAVLLFVCVGVYSINNNPFDVFLAAGFGLLGYVFVKLGCEAAPLLLGLILGPMVEENFRRALLLSRGDPTVFFTRPISLVFMLASLALVLLAIAPALLRWWRRRPQTTQQGGS